MNSLKQALALITARQESLSASQGPAARVVVMKSVRKGSERRMLTSVVLDTSVRGVTRFEDEVSGRMEMRRRK